MNITENFQQAVQDYIFLIEKKYPEKKVLELVATRYALNHFERSVLFRGITTREKAAKRISRSVTIEQLDHRILHIDLFNILFTIAAYLRGFPVYLAGDGFLRDASESHGRGGWQGHLDQGLDLLIRYLEELKILQAVIYIDNSLEFAPVIMEKLRQVTKEMKPAVEIISAPSPDQQIRKVSDGIISTSDSTIIDKSIVPVFDLARHILDKTYHCNFMSL
jgi:hypothetical protein